MTAQIDFTEQEQTQEQYQPNADPQKMAIRSRQASLAEQGNRRSASGVPGALSNTPPAPATAPITQPLNTPADDKKRKPQAPGAAMNPHSLITTAVMKRRTLRWIAR